jgi:hypothetical protein
VRENWQAVARRYVTALAVAGVLAVAAQSYLIAYPCEDTSWLCYWVGICFCGPVWP